MAGYLTSYVGLFAPHDADVPPVTSIEIPLIQRDYAQGRTDGRVPDIRARFLDVLHDALTSGTKVGLDFVYGDVEGGTLRPLDGQQRLTTLFLLHWYLGHRAEQINDRQPWMSFSYATRPSARLFCRRLAMAAPPPDVTDPAEWIVDQSWYLYVWNHDPTIQAMLVMINAIHERFRDCNALVAWERLVSADDPAISFQLLPIDEMGSGEELYIKMNSRGKPLTAFENFKARFEREISWAGEQATAFDHRVDGPWSDILWRYRGNDNIVDDAFMRYLAFITDVCEWRLGRIPNADSSENRALRLFGAEGADATASLSFLFHAFDTWADADINEEFRRLFTFTHTAAAAEDQPLLLFGTDRNVDLFDACCRNYDTNSKARFNYGRTLFLLAILLNRANPADGFPRRLRVLRNLIEASESEFRPNRLPALVADVQRIIVDGSLDEIKGFNRAQAEDEQVKWAFLDRHPALATALFRLEDHYLLRGSLQAFELDAETFEHRAAAFETLMASSAHWRDLTGSLLAAGDYARHRNDRDLQFGSPSNGEPWRNLLTGTTRANLANTAKALGTVLDAVAAGTSVDVSLREIREAFVEARAQEENFDWRYHLVRYAAMREGPSGIYASVGGAMGYQICMLNKTQMNGRHRDPYLTALVREAQAFGVSEPVFIGGYPESYRWLTLPKSGTALRNAPHGFILRPPPQEEFLDAFRRFCTDFGVDERLNLAIPQRLRGGRKVDTEDRVRAGARLLRSLLAAGL
ncbi:DUF262 domain-containing protein [Micromonospora sp. WMMD736]|uniref:DUF262 domain-containing protein n=1 Tax=Micromonospora sp. WMMD736 TaxID=3404112 RepID=UPI003B923E1A